MNKLTAEKCRSHIARLKRYEGESLYQFPFEIEMLEAFEIALPILEQQERSEQVDILSTPEYVLNEKWNAHFGSNQQPDVNPQADEGEWIEWRGGNGQPTDMAVEVRYRDGIVDVGWAYIFNWGHRKAADDIIAYRIIPERATNQNGEQ